MEALIAANHLFTYRLFSNAIQPKHLEGH